MNLPWLTDKPDPPRLAAGLSIALWLGCSSQVPPALAADAGSHSPSSGGATTGAQQPVGGDAASGGAATVTSIDNQTGGAVTTGGVTVATGGVTAVGGLGGASSTGGAMSKDAGPDAASNILPVPILFYEIVTNEWVQVHPGDTVTRPVNFDINWGACSSYDPDGNIAEVWLFDGRLTQLAGPGLDCIQEYTVQLHDPISNLGAYLLVKDNNGAVSELDFVFTTQ